MATINIDSLLRTGVADGGYTFTQPSPNATWTINHNLGRNPSVELLSTGGAEMDGDVIHINLNQIVVIFTSAVAGKAILR